jgi:FkbM family methyltransferase
VLVDASLFLRAAYRAFISPAKPKRSYSQYAEDLLIELALAQPRGKGFYVDVGCHHPRRGSNTYSLYRKGWNGLLIDLEEVKVLACKLLRWRDRAILTAVSDREQEVEIFSPKDFSTNTTIDLRSVTEPEKYRPIGRMQAKTLTAILNEHQVPRQFELLSIDAEGADFEAIKGLDFEQYYPKVICIENWESVKGVEAVLVSPIHRWLDDRRYHLTAWCGLSTIYKRK